MPLDVEQRVRGHADGQEQIAIGTATDTRGTLALEANALAIGHAGRDLDVQGLGGKPRTLAHGIGLRNLEADLLGLLAQGFFQKYRQFKLHVLPSPAGTALLLTGAPERVASTTAEHRAEKVRKIATLETASGPASAFPAWRRLEWPTMLAAVLANFIEFGAFLRIAQHFVGLVGFLEFVFGVALFADIRVILAGQLAVRGLDRLVVRCGLYAKYLVVVFEVHLGITSENVRVAGEDRDQA